MVICETFGSVAVGFLATTGSENCAAEFWPAIFSTFSNPLPFLFCRD